MLVDDAIGHKPRDQWFTITRNEVIGSLILDQGIHFGWIYRLKRSQYYITATSLVIDGKRADLCSRTADRIATWAHIIRSNADLRTKRDLGGDPFIFVRTDAGTLVT